MMDIRWQEPVWLVAAAAALPLAVLGLRWFSAMTRGRRWVSVLLRVLLFVLLASALAGAVLMRTVDRQAVIAVVDRSASVQRLYRAPAVALDGVSEEAALAAQVGGFLDQATRQHRRVDDVSATLVYDTAAIAVSGLTPRRGVPFLEGSLALEGGTESLGTDTGRALRTAAAMAPPNATSRVVLFTDGNDTGGDAISTALAMAARGIATDIVPLLYDAPADVAVESIEAPSIASAESMVLLRVALSATRPTTGTLRVAREGEPIDASPDEPGLTRTLNLPTGRTIVRIPVRLPAGRVHRFEALFEPHGAAGATTVDAIAENNRGESLTLTPGRSSVLIIDGVSADADGNAMSPALAGRLAEVLRAAGMEVESREPGTVPADPLWLQRFDLIALQNVPADGLNEGVPLALAEYVTQQGGGLVMIGGPDSFGAGGWRGTPVEPILPVRLDLPERLISPAAAVMIVIDCSGSMGFRVGGSRRSKQAIANDGAAAAVRALDNTDLLGVVIFNNQPELLISLSPNDQPERSAKLIEGIEPDGGTNVPPALEMAANHLRAAKAETKHIIVLSDGRSQNTQVLPSMVESIAADGIKVSTIAVGDEADGPTMSRMASAGGGAYYRVVDPNLLPRIFVKAVRVVRTPLIREQPFQPVALATGSPVIDGLSSLGIPPLNGLVLTQPRAEPTVTYAMLAGVPTGEGPDRRGGEPLLAHWNAGVGQVAAFTSDAHHWASPWLNWPGHSRMWTQLVRTIARPQADRSQELRVEADGDELVVTALLNDRQGRPIDGADVAGTMRGPAGASKPLRLSQTGAGEYQARVRAPDAGSWIVTLAPQAGTQPLPPLVGGVARSGVAEFRRLSTNMDAIRSLAQAGGGRVLDLSRPEAAGLFDRAGVAPLVAREPIWRWLIIAGIALYLLDVGSRRVAWDRLLPDRVLPRRRAAEAAVAGRAATTVGRLRERDAELEEQSGRGELPPKLSVEDARAIVRAEAERRKQQRAASRRQFSDEAQRPPAPAMPPPKQPEPESNPEPVERPSSLLDAKRRARRKFDDGPNREDSGG